MRRKVAEDMSEAQLWAVMQSLRGRTFTTAKGLQFTVTLAGNELFVSRKRKSITRATVWRAYMRLLELQARGEVVDGPRKLGTFGASYLYAIFIAVGVLPTPMLEAMGASNGNMRGCREMDMPPTIIKCVTTQTFARGANRFGRRRSVATEPSKSRGARRLLWVSKSASDFDIIVSCGQRITQASMWLLSTSTRV